MSSPEEAAIASAETTSTSARLTTMQISPEMRARIEREIDDLNPEPVGHMNYEGIKYQGLPLFATIGEVWLLRSDGSLWRVDSDLGLHLEPLPPSLHTSALVAGTVRYPWLSDLLPRRPHTAVSCDVCGGTGRIGPGGKTFCYACGALGWKPATDPA